MTISKMAIQVEESRADQKVEGFKQQLDDEMALEPVDDLVELEDIVEEVEGDEEGETPIRDCQERIKKKKEKEKEEEIKEKEKKLKNEKKKKVVETKKKKGKSKANIEKKKEATPIECKEVPYPLVPSRKDKE